MIDYLKSAVDNTLVFFYFKVGMRCLMQLSFNTEKIFREKIKFHANGMKMEIANVGK